MKLLHITFHTGCKNDIEYVCKELNIDCKFFVFSENDVGGDIYALTKAKANMVWNKYKEYFNNFDCIITSDTAPLSRIFLQNNWEKKLIIWICNRFDYGVNDMEYYSLIRNASTLSNVKIISNTLFENFYCKFMRNVDITNEIIKPYGGFTSNEFIKNEELNTTFLVKPYHNETNMMNLSNKLTELGIKNYCGKYENHMDILNYKAVINIPYAWSTIAFFEALSLGVIHFIPSLKFIIEMKMKNHNFWWQNSSVFNYIQLSEWYCREHRDLLVYFDSWDHLKELIHSLDYEKQKEKIINFSKIHKKDVLEKWSKVLL